MAREMNDWERAELAKFHAAIMPEKINISEFIDWMEERASHPTHALAIKSFKIIRRNKGEIKIDWKYFAKINGFTVN